MRIEIAPNDFRMTSSGKGVLRSLQNDNLPYIDLVIRESFQNSLDAALPESNHVKIDVNIKEFVTDELALILEGVTEPLLAKYCDYEQALIISDKQTTGLQGDFNTDSADALKKSNIHKLIYGISMNQDSSGAGGSWGLGKTSYFRIGAGIVIYYTRIKLEDGTYAERLAGSLIENEDSPEKLLKESSRGLAWWGDYDDENKNSYPITNSNEIKNILSVFGMEPYDGMETGTSIIIPFIDSELLLPKKDVVEEHTYAFDKSMTEQIKLSIQRWYGSRIGNSTYFQFFDQPVLVPSVNGTIVDNMSLIPMFKWMADLYTSALTGEVRHTKIKVKEISGLRLTMDNSENLIGRVAYTVLNESDLKMLVPNNYYSPLSYLNISAKDKISKNSAKIMAYARKPGMVVEYDVDGSWTSGIVVPDDEYLLAFFVPNSNGKLHANFRSKYEILDDYLRDTENADHASWKDKHLEGTKVTIVERTKKEVVKQIQKELNPKEETGLMSSKTTLLAKKFGSKLLPPSNFGKTSNRVDLNEKEKSISHKIGKKLTTVNVTDVTPINDKLEISFELINTIDMKNILYFSVVTQESSVDEKAWYKTMDESVQFPFVIHSLKVMEVNNNLIMYPKQLSDLNVNIYKGDGNSSVNIDVKTKELMVIRGSIVLEVKDPYLSPVLSVKNNNGKEI